MKTLKMITMTIIVALGMMLLSAEAETPGATLLIFGVFILYAYIVSLLYTHTGLFRINKFSSYDLDKDLAEFLYKRGALDAFVSNLNAQSTYKTVTPDLEGIDWQHTPEGKEYWNTLNELWQKGK
jgi:hypothetical protein